MVDLSLPYSLYVTGFGPETGSDSPWLSASDSRSSSGTQESDLPHRIVTGLVLPVSTGVALYQVLIIVMLTTVADNLFIGLWTISRILGICTHGPSFAGHIGIEAFLIISLTTMTTTTCVFEKDICFVLVEFPNKDYVFSA
jgi:hypothetical protein